MFELHPPSDEGGQKEGCEFLAAPTAENWVSIRRQQKQPGVVACTRLAHLCCLAKTLTLTHLQALEMAVLYLFWWDKWKEKSHFDLWLSNAQQYRNTLKPKTPLYHVVLKIILILGSIAMLILILGSKAMLKLGWKPYWILILGSKATLIRVLGSKAILILILKHTGLEGHCFVPREATPAILSSFWSTHSYTHLQLHNMHQSSLNMSSLIILHPHCLLLTHIRVITIYHEPHTYHQIQQTIYIQTPKTISIQTPKNHLIPYIHVRYLLTSNFLSNDISPPTSPLPHCSFLNSTQYIPHHTLSSPIQSNPVQWYGPKNISQE